MTLEEAIKKQHELCDRLEYMQDFNEIVLAALRAQQERENPQPLTMKELRRMDGQPVWVTFLDDVFTIGHTAPLWMIVNAEEKELQSKKEYVCFSDIGWIACRSKPKEDTHD